MALLLVLGLAAIGYSNSDGGSNTSTTDGEPANGDGPDTCDGVVVVESPSGPVRVPADTGLTDATVVCDMEPGAGDEDAIAVLQHALAQCHAQAVTVDGAYGPETAEAVSSVQRSAGIAPDGAYGPATMEAMQWPVDGAGACAAGVASAGAADEPSSGLPATR